MVNQRLSINKTAIARRIANLPKMVTDAIESCAKGQAQALRSEFHDGIKENLFGLAPIKEATISRKEAMGFDRPESPLYGLGDEAEDTYANMMEVFRDEGVKKYVVRPRDGFHMVQKADGSIVRSKFKLKDLFAVHEYGCSISNGFGKGIPIRIPPRPAMRYAYNALMAKLKERDPAKELRQAIASYVREDNKRALKLIEARDWVAEILGQKTDSEKKAEQRDAG
jgi:hypothetical protein